MKKIVPILCLSLCALLSQHISAKKTDFPVYKHEDMALPKPECLPQFSSKDFKVNPARLDLYPDGFLGGDRQTLQKLCDYLLNTADGRAIWETEAKYAAKRLNQWDLDQTSFNRYTYSLFQLENLALIYLFSGHEELGRFIRGHMLQIAGLPYEFWLHAELRSYNPNLPKGGLETGALCTTVGFTASAAADLFSAAEKEQISNALNDKGLKPCLYWLSINKAAVHNWLAVIATGIYVAAKYLNNQDAVEKSITRINDYVNGSMEIDGSYGEGFGYFDYPVKSLFPAVLVMTPAERLTYFSSSNLRYTASWRVSPYLFSSKSSNKSMGLHFGDNSYNSPINSKVATMLAYIYQDPLALWLKNRFAASYDLKEMLLALSASSDMPEPQSPKQADLPLVKAFAAGDSYIRSTWDDDGIVLGMWSGSGSLVNYGHQHPEMGSICMGAYGEYLIVSPAVASYRSPLRYEWDMTTRAANTITIDDKNQLFPASGIYESNTVDVSGYWSYGEPVAEILQCKSGEIADLLVNETALSYHVPMKHVRRSVLFVKEPGYFVIADKIEANESSHKYSWRIHLNNKDGAGTIEEKSAGHWLFKRPSVNLYVYLFSDKTISTSIGQGYMHGPGRDYNPGGVNEGKLGSSIEIEAHNTQNSQSQVYYAVIYPAKSGTSSQSVNLSANTITVGNDIITFNGGECTIEKAGKTEKYNLW